jgi:sulfatase maturation enzyme AslB (radical SAM superfamily)
MVKPNVLCLDAISYCQLQCRVCPAKLKGHYNNSGRGFLRLEDFKNLLDDNPQINWVEFESSGELFLNNEILQIIEYIFKKGVKMSSHGGVNLNCISHDVLEGLVKYQFRSLFCAIDGASEQTYQEYRVGGSFKRVLENIREINRYKLKYRSPYPELTWQFIVFGHNEHELSEAKKMAEELNMRFLAKMSWHPEYSPIRNREFVISQTGWPAVSREDFIRVVGRHYSRKLCLQLWEMPKVNWNGEITGCCMNTWWNFGGNAFNEGYLSAVNNQKIKYARAMLTNNAEPHDEIPCAHCELYEAMRSTGTYFSVNELFRYSPVYCFARSLYHRFPFLKVQKEKYEKQKKWTEHCHKGSF